MGKGHWISGSLALACFSMTTCVVSANVIERPQLGGYVHHIYLYASADDAASQKCEFGVHHMDPVGNDTPQAYTAYCKTASGGINFQGVPVFWGRGCPAGFVPTFPQPGQNCLASNIDIPPNNGGCPAVGIQRQQALQKVCACGW